MPTEPTNKEARLGILAAVVSYITWGYLSPGGKLLLDHAGPWTINLLRTVGSLVIFLILFGPRPTTSAARLLRRDPRHWILGFLLGTTFVFYLMSVQRLEPTVATVLLYLAPVLIAWGAHRFLGEPRDPWIWATAILTLAGVLLAAVQPITGTQPTDTQVLGLALGIISVLFWSAYTLMLRHIGTSATAKESTLTSFAVSGLIFLLGAAVAEGLRFDVNPTSLALLAFYILFPSVTSFLLYAYAVRRAGASVTGVLIGIELLSTAIVSSILLAEPFGPEKIIGMLIVAAAVTAFLVRQYRVTQDPQKTL